MPDSDWLLLASLVIDSQGIGNGLYIVFSTIVLEEVSDSGFEWLANAPAFGCSS